MGMMVNKPNYYALLGIFRDATQDEIKKAYFEVAQRLHPDKNVAVGETEIFLEIQKAFDILSNPVQRAKYDAEQPEKAASHSPVVERITYSRPSLVRINETQLVYALLEWKPRKNEEEVSSPPLNVCLVLDRSTSMKHEKMDMVKAAAIHLLRGLRQQDVMGMVTFSDHAEVIIPSSIHGDKHRMESKIRAIQPSGATELFKGLEAGIIQVRQNLAPERVNHVILLTDGHTYGDEEACLKLAAQAAKEGIGISGLGIGEDWHDTFLDELAAATGSSSMYIAEPQGIQHFLEAKFAQFVKTFAEQVVIKFKHGQGIELQYAFRLQPNSGPLALESPLQLGAILNDAPLRVLLEFSIHAAAVVKDVAELLQGVVQISIPTQPLPVPPSRLRLFRPVTEAAVPEPPSPAIIQALANLNFYRMQERAQQEVAAGEHEQASQRLQHLATHLLSSGEKKLAQTVLLEAEHLQRMHSLSDEGQKNIKYGTRALLLPAEKGNTL